MEFYKVDVDEQGDIAQEVGVRAVRLAFLLVKFYYPSYNRSFLNGQMPTFVVFKDGNKVSDLVGANPGKLEVGRTWSLLLHETEKKNHSGTRQNCFDCVDCRDRAHSRLVIV